jgi:hypothetical protein
VDGSNGEGIIFDLREPFNVTTHTEKTRCLFLDPTSDSLYLKSGTSIYKWEAGATYRTLVWKSKDFWFGSPWEPSTARVIADSYPAAPSQVVSLLIMSGDGDSTMTTQSTTTVTSLAAFRLAVSRKERIWNVQVTSAVPVSEVGISTGMEGFRT